ncbi:MAG TPA: hypothetical protein VF587_07820 [Solirubrobacteraceae bacterium]
MDEFDVLVGEWSIEAFGEVGGRVTFEWLEGRRFLVQRWTVDVPEAPDGIAVIGPTVAGDGIAQHYFDSRGIARVYGTSLESGVWRLWRDGPDFAQRFAGRLGEDRDTIEGAWEKAMDGSTWEHDFAMTYRRAG